MKNARSTEVKPSALDALSKRPDYSTLQITIKALPWLTLHAAAIVVVSLNAGGVQ